MEHNIDGGVNLGGGEIYKVNFCRFTWGSKKAPKSYFGLLYYIVTDDFE